MLQDYKLRLLQRISPKLLWQMYAAKCAKVLNKAYLILSFDCDTEEDMQVVTEVHTKLQDIGITPVYAVPGELLQKGDKVYGQLYASGAEFINHGGRTHTYYDQAKARHASCFFYDQQSADAINEDIYAGHAILQDVLGMTPIGWRTPHFGTYQLPEQLAFLYKILQELNYKFSSSTTPRFGYAHGPSYSQRNIVEIPVTGIFNEPFNIMDTWAFFAAPERIKNPQDYITITEQLLDFMTNKPMLINIYGDPSHIHDKPEFFTAMRNLVSKARSINFTQYLGLINAHVCSVC